MPGPRRVMSGAAEIVSRAGKVVLGMLGITRAWHWYSGSRWAVSFLPPVVGPVASTPDIYSLGNAPLFLRPSK